MLKLKLQYCGCLMQRTDSLEKTLMLGKLECKRGWQKMKCLDSITDSMDMNLSKLQGEWRTDKPDMLQTMGSQKAGRDLMIEQQQQNCCSQTCKLSV